MPNVFICYRRIESTNIALALKERLTRESGPDSVFLDVHSIPLGEAFPDYLCQAIHWADVILILIGPSWDSIRDPTGTPRLESRFDHVRIEVEQALARKQIEGIPVVPVTHGGVQLSRLRVPAVLSGLTKLAGRELNTPAEMDQLVAGVTKLVVRGNGRRLIKPLSLPLQVNLDQFKVRFGGPLHRLPHDARALLWPVGGRFDAEDAKWEVDIVCRSQPGLETRIRSGIDRCREAAACGAVVEWYDLSPHQIGLWRPEAARVSFVDRLIGRSPHRDDGAWTPASPWYPSYTRLRSLLRNLDTIADHGRFGICVPTPPPPGQILRDGYSVFGQLASPRRFGRHLFSVTTELGGPVDHSLVWFPQIPDTRLQVIPGGAIDVKVAAHIGEDELGFHAVFVHSS